MEKLKLDNPVWYSLQETHKNFALEYEGIKFYDPAYCSFGGLKQHNRAVKGISEYAQLVSSFFVVGEQPQLDPHIQIKQQLVCNQMLLENVINRPITEKIVALKTDKQKVDLFDLVTLVQPGYFKPNTTDLGNYFGIYKDDKLIAAAGERMKMKGFTEVSAVVTHPNYIRRGYAKQLIKRTTDQIFSENKLPYLHVAESNIGAIALYKKIGFGIRRKIIFWNLYANSS